MAKWGEGDPRWIVEDRADATNVNNWHWVEKNATPWSKQRFAELFTGQRIEQGPIHVKFTEFKRLDGEATANNRKAKLIFLYEWEMELKFTANVAGVEVDYTGYVDIPNLSDENSADEITINVNIDTRGPQEAEIRHFLAHRGLDFVRSQCAVYIRELKEEFSRGLILPTDKVATPQVVVKGRSVADSTVKAKTGVDKKDFQNHVVPSSSARSPSPFSSKPATATEIKTTFLELHETFKVPPDRLYEILTSAELAQAWANKGAVVDARVGGEFNLYSGQIVGRFEKLAENKELVAKFRLKKYPEGHYATAKFTLKDQADSTDLVIEADAVPEEQLEETKMGFSRYYFQSIARTFCCGLKLF